ncbi:hypothetical protein ABK040_009873 [Willaertia magna]
MASSNTTKDTNIIQNTVTSTTTTNCTVNNNENTTKPYLLFLKEGKESNDWSTLIQYNNNINHSIYINKYYYLLLAYQKDSFNIEDLQIFCNKPTKLNLQLKSQLLNNNYKIQSNINKKKYTEYKLIVYEIYTSLNLNNKEDKCEYLYIQYKDELCYQFILEYVPSLFEYKTFNDDTINTTISNTINKIIYLQVLKKSKPLKRVNNQKVKDNNNIKEEEIKLEINNYSVDNVSVYLTVGQPGTCPPNIFPKEISIHEIVHIIVDMPSNYLNFYDTINFKLLDEESFNEIKIDEKSMIEAKLINSGIFYHPIQHSELYHFEYTINFLTSAIMIERPVVFVLFLKEKESQEERLIFRGNSFTVNYPTFSEMLLEEVNNNLMVDNNMMLVEKNEEELSSIINGMMMNYTCYEEFDSTQEIDTSQIFDNLFGEDENSTQENSMN